MSEERPLNMKQKRFCREYMLDHNGAQAAIRAGYSEKTAKEQASQLLTKLNVQQYIKDLEDGHIQDWKITREDIVNRWIDLGINTDPTVIMEKFWENSHNLGQFFDSLTPSERLLVKEITTTTSKEGIQSHNLKLHDQTRALEVLSKHAGLYKESGNEGTGITLEKLVIAALERKKE